MFELDLGVFVLDPSRVVQHNHLWDSQLQSVLVGPVVALTDIVDRRKGISLMGYQTFNTPGFNTWLTCAKKSAKSLTIPFCWI